MKAERSKEKGFVPVVVTLESQEEVDCLWALLHSSSVVLARW